MTDDSSTTITPTSSRHPSRVRTGRNGSTSTNGNRSLRPKGAAANGHDIVVPLRQASERAGLPKLAQRLEDVRLWLADDLQTLDGILHQWQPEDALADLAGRAAQHLLTRPGKRIRPLCVMLSAKLVGLPPDRAVRDLALASELVHAATLLHDDVIDEGQERRGVPAARVVYGNSASILGGDYLLIEALERVTHACQGSGTQQPLLTLLDTIAQMVAGEARQLERRGRFEPDRATYLQVVDGKTASLFRWALSAPALHAQRDATTQAALARAGSSLGLAFQLVDDVLDLEGDAATTGKSLFADLLQGKLTWPLILAAEADATVSLQVQQLADQAADDALDPVAAVRLVRQLRASGCIDATRRYAREQQQVALDALHELPSSRARDALFAVVCAAVERAA